MANETQRTAEAASVLAAIDALLPELRGRAAEVEQRGMVPDDIIRSLTSAGVSGSAPPVAAAGFITDFRPGGRSIALLSWPAATMPERPSPLR